MGNYWTNLLAVLAGSAIGGAARYWVSGAVNRRLGERFPWGTLVVNITGAVLIGILAAMPLAMPLASSEARALLIVGLCGSYTTVSSFALQTLALARDAQWRPALGNVLASVLLCLAGAWAGYAATVMMTGPAGGAS